MNELSNKLEWEIDSLLSQKKSCKIFQSTEWLRSTEKNFSSSFPKLLEIPSDSLRDSILENTNDINKAISSVENSDSEIILKNEIIIEGNDFDGKITQQGQSDVVNSSVENLEIFDNKLKIARQQGYVQGLKDGMAKTLLDLEEDRKNEKEIIKKITIELESIQKDSFRFFEPLKKLALHIAEQLVRGELLYSGEIVERLIKYCLLEIKPQDEVVKVLLNPADFVRVQPLIKELDSKILFQSDNNLTSGSICVKSNDTLIEDFIESRLEILANKLIFDPKIWIKESSTLANNENSSLQSSNYKITEKFQENNIEDVDSILLKNANDEFEGNIN